MKRDLKSKRNRRDPSLQPKAAIEEFMKIEAFAKYHFRGKRANWTTSWQKD
jgi:hypothetical protein